MDISTLSAEQLKALGYDLRVDIERNQNNLRLVENRIMQLAQENAMEIAKNGDPNDTVVPPTIEPEAPKAGEKGKDTKADENKA